MHPAYDAVEGSLGYRSIIVTFKYAPANTSWGDLIDTMAADSHSLLKSDCEALWGFWPEIETFVAQQSIRDAPASFCAEVQLILSAYLDYRRTSHFPYKVQRVRGWNQLHTEFAASGGAMTGFKVVSKAVLGLMPHRSGEGGGGERGETLHSVEANVGAAAAYADHGTVANEEKGDAGGDEEKGS
jgi:hypothetical protein